MVLTRGAIEESFCPTAVPPARPWTLASFPSSLPLTHAFRDSCRGAATDARPNVNKNVRLRPAFALDGPAIALPPTPKKGE